MRKKYVIFKTVATIIIALLAMGVIYYVGTGFTESTTVVIDDFSVSEGGDMTISILESSSVGYVRDVQVKKEEDGVVHLNFHEAFGGMNGKIGAKDSFTFHLDGDETVIAVHRGIEEYEDVLYKDEKGRWRKVEAQ